MTAMREDILVRMVRPTRAFHIKKEMKAIDAVKSDTCAVQHRCNVVFKKSKETPVRALKPHLARRTPNPRYLICCKNNKITKPKMVSIFIMPCQ